ncbi:ribonuclease E, partial [Synechococcus sp. BA-124 BA4]|nr:ribonuclease E [Synechococcus sp. BA-124 BA4]
SGADTTAPITRSSGEVPTPRREIDAPSRYRQESPDDDAQSTLVEITPLPEAFGEPDEAPMTTVIESTLLQIPVSQVSSPGSERVGRSQPRGRQHRPREEGGAVAVAEAPSEAPPTPLVEDGDPGGEPRRRRRRSSASV